MDHGTTTATTGGAVEVASMVGHLLRRAHQVHHAVWAEEVGGVLTPPQFAALEAVAEAGDAGVDQATVGQAAALDRSTAAGVVQRLQEQCWITRTADPQDGRRRLLRATAPALLALTALQGPVQRVQQRLLAALSADQRQDLARLLWLMSGADAAAGAGDLDGGAESAAVSRPGHLIRRAQQRHTALWAQEQQGQLTGPQLTGPQFAVLGLLHQHGPQLQGALATAAGLDRSNASDVLARLQRRGLTSRSAVPGDARTRQVDLTEAGCRAVLEAAPSAQQVQRRLLEPLEPADRPRVTRLLGAMVRGEEAPSSSSP